MHKVPLPVRMDFMEVPLRVRLRAFGAEAPALVRIGAVLPLVRRRSGPAPIIRLRIEPIGLIRTIADIPRPVRIITNTVPVLLSALVCPSENRTRR